MIIYKNFFTQRVLNSLLARAIILKTQQKMTTLLVIKVSYLRTGNLQSKYKKNLTILNNLM